MVFSIYGVDNEFGTATGSNVNCWTDESDFDYPPSGTKDLVITTKEDDPDPRLFEVGDTYEVTWGGSGGGGTITDAMVMRSDLAPGSGQPGIVVFEGLDEHGDVAQLIWTPGFDLEAWYFDNFTHGIPPRFYNSDTDPTYTHSYICFAAEARIAAAGGVVRAAEIAVGDLVQTRDHGLQPVTWVGQRWLAGQGAAAPVYFAPGAIGNTAPLRLSQQHRVLVASPLAESHFGESEVLVPAKALVDGHKIRIQPCARIGYIHLLLSQHEVLCAEGAPCESLHMGTMARQAVAAGGPDWMLCPGMDDQPTKQPATARPVLTVSEARFLAGLGPLFSAPFEDVSCLKVQDAAC